jgi:hypothetical protein
VKCPHRIRSFEMFWQPRRLSPGLSFG